MIMLKIKSVKSTNQRENKFWLKPMRKYNTEAGLKPASIESQAANFVL